MIFQKQYEKILDYLGAPYNWGDNLSGDNLKWRQLTFNARLLKPPEVHMWMVLGKLRCGCHGCGQKLRINRQHFSSYSSVLVSSKLTGFLFKTFFQGQWGYLLYSMIKNQGKCFLINLLPYCTLSAEQDPLALHSWFFIFIPHFRCALSLALTRPQLSDWHSQTLCFRRYWEILASA